MKKLFTLFVAVVAASSMMAADPTYESFNWGADDFATVMTDHNGITLFSPFTEWKGNFSGVQYLALGGSCDLSNPSNYLGVKATAPIDSIEVYFAPNGADPCNIAWGAWLEAENALNQNVDFIGMTEEYTGSKSIEGATWQKISFAGQNVYAVILTRQLKKAILNGTTQSNMGKNKTINVLGIRVWAGAPSTEPVLKVNTESVDLNVTAVNPSVSETVTFSGKNLTAGTYNLVVPTVEGMNVTPTSVVVAEDGKLNAEVTISYTSAVEVAAASANISLTIDTLTQNVAINYSATLAKEYGKSINIEQLVLDNGMAYDIKAALAAAKIDFENIDALDSLNDAKTGRNEPYLGLKLKNAAATMGCWLKAGSTINVKFGNVGGDVNISINGAVQTMTAELLATPLTYTATEDTYVLLSTTSAKTVVVKQIMIDEAIAAVVLPESPVVPEDPTVGLDDINAAAKSVKFFHNGQLLIEKNGVVYNAQGAVVK